MDAGERELHAAYERLIATAARADVIRSSGQTPAEQGAELSAIDTLSADDVKRLVGLLYQCVYGRRGSEVEINEGIALCARVTDGLPDAPLAAGEFDTKRRFGWWAALLAALERLFGQFAAIMPVILIVALALGVAVAIGKSGPGIFSSFVGLGGIGDVSASATGWKSAYSAEAGAALKSDRSWSSPSGRPTFRSASIDPVLSERSMQSARRPGLDRDTGVDGSFRNAEDPFTPPLGWTHRLHVFDRVDADYVYGTAAERPARPATGPADDARVVYTVDVKVVLRRGRPVPIPSPAPDAMVVRYTCSPDVDVQFVKDTADGLYAIGDRHRTVRLRYEIATWIDYSFASLPSSPFVEQPQSLPANVREDATYVIDSIGDLPQLTYEGTVRRLHQYFAGFVVAPIDPDDQRGNSYVTIALSRKGVCRHRARAFFVTATALGIPTRLVENRTHSFCEVQLPDGSWRRMEFRLGRAESAPGTPASSASGVARRELTESEVITYAVFVPLLILILLALLMFWRRADVDSHRLDAAVTRKRLEQVTERDTTSARECVAAIAGIVRTATSGIDLTDEERRRLGRIVKTSRGGSGDLEDGALRDVFWDAYYLMDRKEGGQQ